MDNFTENNNFNNDEFYNESQTPNLNNNDINPPKKKRWKKEVFSWIWSLGLTALVSFILVNYVFMFTVVKGESMLPTLNDNDLLFVEKLSYLFNEPKRGDIVICSYPGSQDHFVKRVVGLSGEKVEIKDNTVYINEKPNLDLWNAENYLITMPPIIIPDNSYFVMGDNRENSKDSRNEQVGSISVDKIQGKVAFRFFPFDSIKMF